MVEKQVHVETLHLGTLNFEEPRKSAQPFGHTAVQLYQQQQIINTHTPRKKQNGQEIITTRNTSIHKSLLDHVILSAEGSAPQQQEVQN